MGLDSYFTDGELYTYKGIVAKLHKLGYDTAIKAIPKVCVNEQFSTHIYGNKVAIGCSTMYPFYGYSLLLYFNENNNLLCVDVRDLTDKLYSDLFEDEESEYGASTNI